MFRTPRVDYVFFDINRVISFWRLHLIISVSWINLRPLSNVRPADDNFEDEESTEHT
jgi:hypothetical protein